MTSRAEVGGTVVRGLPDMSLMPPRRTDRNVSAEDVANCASDFRPFRSSSDNVTTTTTLLVGGG